VFKFFRWIRDLGITTLAVTESYPSGAWHVYDHASLPSSFAAQLSILYHGHDDSFLADGLIKLSMQEAGAGIQRRIQCIKMRGVNHDLEEFALGIKDGRFNITEVL
jgi:KaiC/GvpD/RAD55 family RecA-like ATPase